ncbi:hypothetical protein AB0N87_38130 [Streptomyces sp. NPDC093228]|uniref:hypothetical protein n=1 Tax=unclassified Streptomyces TaxID=2593676 RepID=UPI000E394570|nr:MULTISPECIES: hypothetical protein [unclassified Streptomyces]MDX3265948.1 hypothetical protein [Streptomyces sp. MI02-2A]REE58863.1 hypothetical protein BX257_1327 [Streptomyces sp. 3212.3]
MALLLFLLLVAVVLGIVGVAAEGLGYLLIIGVVIFVAALVLIAVRWSQRTDHRPLR